MKRKAKRRYCEINLDTEAPSRLISICENIAEYDDLFAVITIEALEELMKTGTVLA